MKSKILFLCAGVLLAAGTATAHPQQPGVPIEHDIDIVKGLEGDFTTRPYLAGRLGQPVFLPSQGNLLWFSPGPIFSRHLFSAEMLMRNQRALGLKGEQKASIRKEILNSQTRFTELQWELEDARETLDSLLEKSPTSEQHVLAQLDKLLAAEQEIKRNQIRLMVRLKNRLTTEQQAKLREINKGFHSTLRIKMRTGAPEERHLRIHKFTKP